MTFSKVIFPWILSNFLAFGGLLILGYLSKISNILTAALLPWLIFSRDGPRFVKLNPAINTLKKTTKTSPGVYLSTMISMGQLSAAIIHFDPYQNPRAYDASMTKKMSPIPAPALIDAGTTWEWDSFKHD